MIDSKVKLGSPVRNIEDFTQSKSFFNLRRNRHETSQTLQNNERTNREAETSQDLQNRPTSSSPGRRIFERQFYMS